MEYTNLQYFEFKINMFLNNNIMMTFISLSIIFMVGFFFYLDFNQNGNNFLPFKFKSLSILDIVFLVIPILFCFSLIFVKHIVIQADPPQAVVESKKVKITKNMKVLSVDKVNGKAFVSADNKKKHKHRITVNVYNEGSEKNKTLRYNPKGKNLHRKNIITIKSPTYDWKYKNHKNYENDEGSKKQFHLLNSGKVNCYVKLSN